MAAWSGMNRQDYIIAKLTDTQVEVKPSVSVHKALKDSMAALTREVSLAVSYGELSKSLQQRVDLVIGFFLALGGPVDEFAIESLQQARSSEESGISVMDTDADNASIFCMGR